ncbi:DUF6153 family protein [Streptomyces sp. NPDC054765]
MRQRRHNRHDRYEVPPPARRWRALLVLGLLAGLLGMHALGPALAAPPRPHAHRMAVTATAHGHCHGTDDCGGSGHVHHADPTCASGALDGPPTPHALVRSPLSPVRPAQPAGAGEQTGQDGGRAPPSLAELQLLRI